jgi:hypothetical protein
VRPNAIDGLAMLLGLCSAAGCHVHVVGAGYSCTPLGDFNDILLPRDTL